MANARTRYDTICDYMVRSHGATSGNLYGKPCALLRGHAFLYFHQGWAAFKLRGRIRLQALALAGAKFWDPLGREGPSMEWVIVPDAHFLRWDRFAVEAVKLMEKEAGGRRPEAGPAQGPPPLPPASARWLDGIKTLWARAASLSLVRQEPLPEKPIPTMFSDDSPLPEPVEAEAFAELAEAATESAVAEPVSGRASFAVDSDPAPPPVVTGRASFGVGQDPAPPPPAVSGRASFGVGHDPAPPPITTEDRSEGRSGEAAQVPRAPASAGKASFSVGVDPLPPVVAAPAVVEQTGVGTAQPAAAVSASQGRASFSVGVDPVTPAPTALPEGIEVASSSGDADDTVELPVGALGLSDEPLADGPATPLPTTEENLADWQDRIAKYQIEADQVEPEISGRAVFEAREVEPPGVEPRFKIKESDKPLGRASFLLPDDAPPPSEDPEGIDYPSKPPPGDAD